MRAYSNLTGIKKTFWKNFHTNYKTTLSLISLVLLK